MGILNVTPDSFSQDGCLSSRRSASHGDERAIRRAHRLIHDGADILDVGGESTRPGAQPISVHEEIRRVVPVIAELAKNIRIPISVDTYKPLVAKEALEAGAAIVNNILGTKPKKELLKTVKNYNAAIVLMHIRGIPRTMQKNIRYHHLMAEIIGSLRNSIEKCLEIGIKSDKIIIDPGIGFGKTVVHNLEIINRLKAFHVLRRPLLIGPSRKSFIGHILGKDVSERLWGTLACVCASILNGAHIVRVHDVKAAKDAARMTDAILNETETSDIY